MSELKPSARCSSVNTYTLPAFSLCIHSFSFLYCFNATVAIVGGIVKQEASKLCIYIKLCKGLKVGT